MRKEVAEAFFASALPEEAVKAWCAGEIENARYDYEQNTVTFRRTVDDVLVVYWIEDGLKALGDRFGLHNA